MQIKLKEVLREHFARHEAAGKGTRAIVFTQFRDSVEVGLSTARVLRLGWVGAETTPTHAHTKYLDVRIL